MSRLSRRMLTDAEIIAREHASCNATIAEPQKRIAELEEMRAQANEVAKAYYENWKKAEKRVGELEAERDEARHRYARENVAAVEATNRAQDAEARAESAERELKKTQEA
jgi:predicted S18 family serine protease